MRHRLCCIGHITKDKITTPESSANMPGGTAFYFSKALLRLGAEGFLLVTAVEDDQLHVTESLRKEGIEVCTLPTPRSVCFENIYGRNPNERQQRVTALASPFTAADLQQIEADVIHLGSLLHDDFPTGTIRRLAQRSRLSADAQGFLRRVVDGQVIHTDWDEKHEALKHIHTLKANEQEMTVLTNGCEDPHEAALILADWGVKEVVLTLGHRGSLIYTHGAYHEIPAYPTWKVVDVTGCGDTYMAGYLHMRQHGADVYRAGCFAAAMCTIKLQEHGPFNGTGEAAENIVRNAPTHCLF